MPSNMLIEYCFMLQERELESLCYECGLKIITDDTGCKLLPAKQVFSLPKSGFQSYGLRKIEKSRRYLTQFIGSRNFVNLNRPSQGKFSYHIFIHFTAPCRL